MARLVYLLQGYFHASSDGASSSLWSWDTKKAFYPKGLKQTLRAERRCTPQRSSSRLHSLDLRDHKFAFVNTISSYCKSLAQAHNVVPTVPWIIADPVWHVATLLAPYTPRGENPSDCSKQGPHRRGCRRSKTIRSQLPWSLHRQCLHMFCCPEFATVMFKCQTQKAQWKWRRHSRLLTFNGLKTEMADAYRLFMMLGQKDIRSRLNKARLFSNLKRSYACKLTVPFFWQTGQTCGENSDNLNPSWQNVNQNFVWI